MRTSALAAAAAALLFAAACTPASQPIGAPVGEAQLTDDAIVAIDGYVLPIRRTLPAEGPPRAVILALHGYNDYAHAFFHPARYWAQHGIATYAYDQRGFGRTQQLGIWAGGPTLRHDLRTAIGLLRQAYPDIPLYVLGESMGGAVVISTLADRYQAPEVDGVILVAPATWGRQILSGPEATLLWLTRNLVPGMEFGGQGLGIVPTDNWEIMRRMRADRHVLPWSRADTLEGVVNVMTEAFDRAPDLPSPTILLYGDNEQVLSEDSIDALLEELQEGRHVIANYPDGYHMLLRDLNAEIVWADIAAWIDDPAAPLPSGADKRKRGDEEAEDEGTEEAEAP